MLVQLLVPCLALLGPVAAGYVTVPLRSPASVTYVDSQQHAGLLAGPVRLTSASLAFPQQYIDARSAARVSVTPGQSSAPTYYTYNVQPQAVFGRTDYSPAVQYHHQHHTSYGGPTVRVYEPKSFVYGVQASAGPTTHTVHTVPVSVSTTQYHHTPSVTVTPAPVTPAPHPTTIAVPVHVPVPVPVSPTYTKTVTTAGPTYVAAPQPPQGTTYTKTVTTAGPTYVAAPQPPQGTTYTKTVSTAGPTYVAAPQPPQGTTYTKTVTTEGPTYIAAPQAPVDTSYTKTVTSTGPTYIAAPQAPVDTTYTKTISSSGPTYIAAPQAPVDTTYTKTVTSSGPTYIAIPQAPVDTTYTKTVSSSGPTYIAVPKAPVDTTYTKTVSSSGPTYIAVPQAPVDTTYTKTVSSSRPTYFAAPPQVPVVRSRKFKVRRPAIQNQFYDVEERVIIRPVGSALVELEQPVSQTETRTKTTKTTTTTIAEKRPVYIPAPAPPQEDDSGYGTRIGRPHVVTQTTTVFTERPQVVVQKNGYDRQVQSAASTSKSSDAEFIDTAAVPSGPALQPRPFFTQQHAVYHPQAAFHPQSAFHPQTFVAHPYASPLAPHPFVYHPGNAGHLLHHVSYAPSGPPAVLHVPSSTPLYPVTSEAGPTSTGTAGSDCDRETKTPAYLPPHTQTPSPTPVATTPNPPTGSFADGEEEYDDSIVVDARSGFSSSSNQTTDYEDSTAYEETTPAATTPRPTTTRFHDKYRGEERAAIEISYATRTTPASDIVAFDPSTSSGAFNLGPAPTPFQRSFPASSTAASPTYAPTTTTTTPRPQVSPSTAQRSVTIVDSTTVAPSRPVSARFSETGLSEESRNSPAIVVGQGLSKEEIHANQEQFIRLLSERDSIAQVGGEGVPKGDTAGSLIDAYVRSRVLSATPAPRDAKETSRTVNIRRIVVSRPVETEQEVEVREQSYATTGAPHPGPYEHKRDVSEVSGENVGQQEHQEQLPPVYVNAKPPAFANDQGQDGQ